MSDGEKVDISKIKPGDKVTLVPLSVVPVISNDKDHVWVLTCEGVRLPFHATDIAAHHPAPREFQVGDRVVLSPWPSQGTVIGVDQDEVWVRWDENAYSPVNLASDLTLVEAGQ